MNSKESFVLLNLIMKNGEPKSNEWYDRVYLCWEDTNFKKPTTHLPINGFKCYKYNSFSSADYAWKDLNKKEELSEKRHTMLAMCKWMPEIFDRYLLNWKLKNIYWLGKNSIGRGYNKYNIYHDSFKLYNQFKEIKQKNKSDDKK